MTLKKYIALSSAILVLFIAASFLLLRKGDNEQVRFERIKVMQGDLQTTISSTATVKPKNRLETKPPVSGRIEEMLVEEGYEVQKGKIIGWMSSTDRVALIDAARAKGKEELQRWETIYKPTPIIAAISGTIISRSVEPGQTVTAEDVIVVIADRLILNAAVDETDVAKVVKGTIVQITLDAYPQDHFSGKVDHIAFEATTEENVTVYEVDISSDENPSFMKSGMSAEVIFFTNKREAALYLPATAIQYDTQGAYVYVENNKRLVRQSIKTGIQDGSKLEIVEGVEQGQIVLVEGQGSVQKQEETRNSNPFMPTPPKRRKRN